MAIAGSQHQAFVCRQLLLATLSIRMIPADNRRGTGSGGASVTVEWDQGAFLQEGTMANKQLGMAVLGVLGAVSTFGLTAPARAADDVVRLVYMDPFSGLGAASSEEAARHFQF